jgi:hypothetical protein
MTNDSQKAESSLYAFIEIVYTLLAFLLVGAGGATVGEKLWLRGKAAINILHHTDRLVEVIVPDNTTSLASSDLNKI